MILRKLLSHNKLLKLIFKRKIKYEKYWIQNVPLIKKPDRLEYFFSMCKNKLVIHFGCTDYPIFNPGYNLHIQLSSVAQELHGFDIDLDGIVKLKEYVDQPYYSDYETIKNNKYDVCLVPETIEHVDNIKEFLQRLESIDAKVFIITAPNCFVHENMKRNTFKGGVYSEIVHPDHNCWFSPYTLKNVIEKYSSLKVIQVFLLEQDRMVCCEAVRN